jgi:hypothetical protein
MVEEAGFAGVGGSDGVGVFWGLVGGRRRRRRRRRRSGGGRRMRWRGFGGIGWDRERGEARRGVLVRS